MPIGRSGLLNLSLPTEADDESLSGYDFNGGFGRQVEIIGDINGDGYIDVAVSSPSYNTGRGEFPVTLSTPSRDGLGADETDEGRVHVFLGSSDGISLSVENLDAVASHASFYIDGEMTEGFLGGSIAALGDINGDGFDDFAFSELTKQSADGPTVGKVHVIYGANDVGSLLSSSLEDIAAFSVSLSEGSGYFLPVVSSVGDINGDGLSDFAVGDTNSDPGSMANAGSVHVIFGSKEGMPSTIDATSLDGTTGFSIHGFSAGQALGSAFSSAGDINGDGVDDMIVGNRYYRADPDDEHYSGAVFVVYGDDQGFAPSLTLNQLNGDNGFSIYGTENEPTLGYSVSHIGDINSDGRDDISFTTSTGGKAYVLFGRSSDFGTDVSLASLDGSSGFAIVNTEALLQARPGGDLNGDGIEDLVLSTTQGSFGDRTSVGETNILYGRAGPFDAVIDLDGLEGLNGVRILGPQSHASAGADVGTDGDLDGDGVDDLIIGAPGYEDHGSIHIVYGVADLQISGGAVADTLKGGRGDDTISGGEGSDAIWAGARDQGNDYFVGGTDNDTIGASLGNDTLGGGEGNDLLYASAGDDSLLGGVGDDKLFNGGGSDIVDGEGGGDTLWGGAGDDTLSGGSGRDTFIFMAGHGDDRITDFDIREDTLYLATTTTDFTRVSDVLNAAEEQDGGVLIDLGGGDSLFLAGLDLEGVFRIHYEF